MVPSKEGMRLFFAKNIYPCATEPYLVDDHGADNDDIVEGEEEPEILAVEPDIQLMEGWITIQRTFLLGK